MDPLDFLWNLSQEHQIADLRVRFDRERLERDLTGWDLPKIKHLAEENLELKLRLGMLLRLLISKGVITAPEYAAMIAEARPAS